MRGFLIFHFVCIYESERKKINSGVDKMKKVFSMVAMMVFMNVAMAMAASDLESYNRQDVAFRDGKIQEQLMGDKHADPEKIDPSKAGVRV